MYTTLITAHQLHELQSQDKPLMVFDCSFDLMQPDWGVQQYLEAHIPGALYVDLDTYLSSSDPDNAASGGRHPLPVRSDCVHALRRVAGHVELANAHLNTPAPALDILAEELRLAQNALNSITGEFTSDDLLGEIFGRFCIGK